MTDNGDRRGPFVIPGGDSPGGISPRRLEELRDLIDQGAETRFYFWSEWRGGVREQVLRLDHWECQHCKARGRYARAEIVHHVKHLRDRPDLALSIWDPATGERQLVSLCKACHEAEHPEALTRYEPTREPVTAERWD